MVEMKKNKGFSILRLLIAIICIFSIIISVGVNVLFTQSKIPHISDRYIYIVEEPNPLSGDVSTGAALIAKDAKNVSIAAGDIVICYPADDPSELTLRSINAVVESEYGTERFYTRDSVHEDNTDSITKDKILAVCTGYPESVELGQFLLFTLDIKGIIAELIVPCVILLILLIIKIASSKNAEDDDEDDDEDDEEYGFYNYDESENKKSSSKKKSKTKGGNPLFEPEIQPAVNDELERKKMSIAENFSQKEVNHDSPYQKEKERTMQFKAQKAAETAKFAAQKANNNKPAYPSHAADSSADENLSKQSAKPLELERFEAPAPSSSANAPAHEKTPEPKPVKATADIKDIDEQKAINIRTQAPASVPLPSAPEPAGSKPVDSSPDISDIIRKTEKIRNKKKVDAMSVDDLIRMIDEEKNKL